MSYTHIKKNELPKKEKYEINLTVYPPIGECGFVIAETTAGHNEEFYHVTSTFHYLVLKGSGSFFLDDEEVAVEEGDFLSISPKTRIYYKGAMKLLLITNPPWNAENEVETKPKIW